MSEDLFDDYDDYLFTQDDEVALRLLSIAIAFLRSSGPISSLEVYERFYEGLSVESAQKSFSRDRQRLAAAGFLLKKSGINEQNAPLWEVDSKASLVEDPVLSKDDARLINLVCLPLVNDASYQLRHELFMALIKIDRSFGETSVARLSENAKSFFGKIGVSLLEASLSLRCTTIYYTRADGSSTERTIAPYGFFSLRGQLYVVGPRTDVKDAPIHTYNVGRIQKASVTSRPFVLPDYFDVYDFLKLPFQLGKLQYDCAFVVPLKYEVQLRKATHGHGEWSDSDDGLVFKVQAAELNDCASWAIAQGIQPLEPPELVDVWRASLEEVLDHAE